MSRRLSLPWGRTCSEEETAEAEQSSLRFHTERGHKPTTAGKAVKKLSKAAQFTRVAHGSRRDPPLLRKHATQTHRLHPHACLQKPHSPLVSSENCMVDQCQGAGHRHVELNHCGPACTQGVFGMVKQEAPCSLQAPEVQPTFH